MFEFYLNIFFGGKFDFIGGILVLGLFFVFVIYMLGTVSRFLWVCILVGR